MNLSIFFYIKRKSVSQNKNLTKDTCYTSVAALLLHRLYSQWYQFTCNSDKGSHCNSGPQPFWHRGPVCGRQLLPWIGRGRCFQDDSHKKHAHVQFTEGLVRLWESKAAADLRQSSGGDTSSSKYRWNSACSPAVYWSMESVLICGWGLGTLVL